MPERIHAQQQTPRETPEIEELPATQDHRDTTDIDDLLDEIDSVLETNAAEFVAQYVQQGGE